METKEYVRLVKSKVVVAQKSGFEVEDNIFDPILKSHQKTISKWAISGGCRAEYAIMDIKMRMLRVPELLRIQGFSDKYFLAVNQSHQKKFIGNSVPPPMVKALIEASYIGLNKLEISKIA